MQGWDNFRKEAKQLRRSFRFNEYKEIRAQNPPRNFFTRVSSHSLPIECPLKGVDARMGSLLAADASAFVVFSMEMVGRAVSLECDPCSFCRPSTSR